MTDYVLRAADQATMYAGFQELGLFTTDGEGNEVLRTQGLLNDGTAWCLVDQGIRAIQTGVDKDGNPIFVTDQYWVPLRWNGDAPLPNDPAGVQIVWQSDAEPPTDYPEGVTRFA